MRIQNDYRRSIEQTTVKVPARVDDAQKGTGKPASAPVSSGDVRVSVSKEALNLEANKRTGMDEAKVQRLTAAIADNSFRVDSKAIAKRIVDGG